MSTEHNVNVVRLGPVIKHDNADSLGITEVDGRPCIIRLSEWAEGDLAVYIPIDSVVPLTDERFAFLKHGRIKAMRLRGVFSMGLLVKPEPDMNEGDEVRERLGITVYEPDASVRGGGGPGARFVSAEAEPDPGFLPVYDIESARKYRSMLREGEEVVVTEKIHGANGRFAFHRDRLWVASRNQFKREDDADLWWGVAHRLGLAERLAEFPGIAIYGEVYGQVQDLRYGLDDARLAVFDALDIESRRWLDYDEMCKLAAALGLDRAPVLFRGAWSAADWEAHKALAEGDTVIGKGACVREGWVLRPTVERWDARLGRVIMKLHGEGYLTRKGA